MLDGTAIGAALVVAFAGTVSGLTGFGFALVALPPLLLLLDPAPAVLTVKLLPMVTGAVVLFDARRHVHWPTVRGLILPAAIGAALGVLVLARTPGPVLSVLSGALVAGFALVLLAGWAPRRPEGAGATVVAGFASGLLSTANGMAGPPVVLLFNARGYGTQPFRGTLAAYFAGINVVGVGMLLAGGVATPPMLRFVALLVAPAVGGVLIGRLLSRRVPSAHFRRLTLLILVATGAVAVGNGLAVLTR